MYNWGDTGGPSELSHLTVRSSNHIHRSPSGVEETEWEPFDETPGSSTKLEEARKRREEKKLQRQKELEARRANRSTGPMKLGSKKI